MSIFDTATAPAPTRGEIRDLVEFLSANIDVAVADGEDTKANKFSEFRSTVRRLAEPGSHDRNDVELMSARVVTDAIAEVEDGGFSRDARDRATSAVQFALQHGWVPER